MQLHPRYMLYGTANNPYPADRATCSDASAFSAPEIATYRLGWRSGRIQTTTRFMEMIQSTLYGILQKHKRTSFRSIDIRKSDSDHTGHLLPPAFSFLQSCIPF